MKKIVVFVLLLMSVGGYAQNRNSVWCFGDSALVDFSDTSNIITGTSQVKSRGSCASIADSTGNLLFYVAYDLSVIISGTDPVKIYNANHQVMVNGDSLKGGGWYNEIIITPCPGNDSLYYVFYIGVTLDFGLYYSVINISANGGLGAVTQKNVQLENFKQVDCLTAVKHGNGRDWWIIFRKADYPLGTNNFFYTHLLTAAGISPTSFQQAIGSQNSTNLGNISFNHSANKMVFTNLMGLMEIFDFDRCTGLLSNPQTIYPEQTSPFSRYFWGGEFSPSGNYFYATTIPVNQQDTSRLIQYDLTSANISQSADTLWETGFISQMGALKLAPDGKIYLTTNYSGGYPYSDTTFNYINTNLSVINNPDNGGVGCNFQPYSFSLGGNRSYFGLPNNPDYEMPALAGSPCDTITSLFSASSETINAALLFSYVNNWEKLFVNAQHLKGKNCVLQLIDVSGKVVFSTQKKTLPPYFTADVDCGKLRNGVYFVRLVTDEEMLVGRFVKQ